MQQAHTGADIVLPDYSTETLKALQALSDKFDSQGYHGYSEATKQAFLGFWGDSAQADLIASIFPTTRDKSKGTIRPVYPKGGFDPRCQALTAEGLMQLFDAVWSKDEVTTRRKNKWIKLDGYLSSVEPENSAVSNVVGGAIKPINGSVIAIDLDLDFFSGDRHLPESVVKFFVAADDAYRVRGNRNRLSLIYRQSDCLKAHLDSEYPGINKIVLVSKDNKNVKVEISIRDGCSNNIFGEHKDESSYQVLFPENDCINPLDELGFTAIISSLLSDERFVKKVSDPAARASRMTAQELATANSYVHQLTHVISGVHSLVEKFGVSGAIDPRDLFSDSTLKVLRGELAFIEANVSVSVDRMTPQPFKDGMRRNTTWQAFTDISFTFQFLREMNIPHDADFERQYVQKIAEMITPDVGEVFVTAYDAELGTYKTIKCRKWSEEYTIAHYNETYYDSDKCTVAYDFGDSFVRKVIHLLGVVLQEFLCSKKISDLAGQGRKLASPDMDQTVRLATFSLLPDLSEADELLDDMFEVVFDLKDHDTLIDDETISSAISQKELKAYQRKLATNDEWGIFPKYFSNHVRRYLRRQQGASYPFAVAIMTALISQSGFFQVTADPISDAEFDSVSSRDGRERYVLNSDGNPLLLMQILTGDSGAGKSYITKPIDNALRIVSIASTNLDSYTYHFLKQVTDKNKFRAKEKYSPIDALGGTISANQYSDILDVFRDKPPYHPMVVRETFAMSDHGAEIAAIRDSMMETELRMRVRQICNGKLFIGSFYHPMFLYFDEAGAFIENVYQNSAKITSFCELKGANPKSFRRANSNLSGSQNDITFWGATLHGNIPLPKFLASMYKADVKDQKAEGVMGRVLLGYIERNDDVAELEEFDTPYKGRTDEEIISTLISVAMLIPKAVRIVHDELGEDGSCYFSSFRSSGNFYMTVDCIEELKKSHDLVFAKIEEMKRLYPEHDYAYGTYQGKIYEMLYTLAGGHKLMTDLIKVASKIIPKLKFKVYLGSSSIEYDGWEISQYVKDKSLQNHENNGRFMDAIRSVLIDIEADPALKSIRNPQISKDSMVSAAAILSHHYDVLTYCEVLYQRIIGNVQDGHEAARKATTNALAERHNKTFVAYRVVDNLDKRLRIVSNSTRKFTQSDIIRNMLYQCGKGQDDPEASKQLIIQTFNTLVGRLVRDGHLGAAANGKSWFMKTTYADIQPILGELRISYQGLI